MNHNIQIRGDNMVEAVLRVEDDDDNNVMEEEEETVQLSIRASNLPNVGSQYKGKSDPFGVVTLLPYKEEKESKILGMTEVLKNTLNPDFTTNFLINYKKQQGNAINNKALFFLVKILDEVAENDYREMGSGVFEINSILGMKNVGTMTKKLPDGGTIDINAEKIVGGVGSLHLKMRGISLQNPRGKKKKCLPFFQFSRVDIGERGIGPNVFHKAEPYHENSLEPEWDNEIIDLKTLCHGNLHQVLLLSVYHHKSNGIHVLIGEVETSVNDLLSAQELALDIFIRKDGVVTGRIAVDGASIQDCPLTGFENRPIEESNLRF